MGFASGAMSFRRFAVTGPNQPNIPTDELLTKVKEAAFFDDNLTSDPKLYGWCGCKHLLDLKFEDVCLGESILFAIRIQTNVVPGSIVKAQRAFEESVVAKENPSGFISKIQKREVKDKVAKWVDEQLKTGKYKKSALYPVLWDMAHGYVYTAAKGKSLDALYELFERTFKLKLDPISAGSLSSVLMGANATLDLKPTRFVLGPGGESQWPEYPWVSKGCDTQAWLGNEFMMWLAAKDDHRVIKAVDNHTLEVGLYNNCVAECAFGESGVEKMKCNSPIQSPEGAAAFASGKVIRQSDIMMDCDEHGFTFSLQPETMTFTKVVVPEVEEADTPATLAIERFKYLHELMVGFDALYKTFLQIRCDKQLWGIECDRIRTWIDERRQKTSAAAQ